MCLAADIPLIESGTAGYLGQVTVIKKVGFKDNKICTQQSPGNLMLHTPHRQHFNPEPFDCFTPTQVFLLLTVFAPPGCDKLRQHLKFNNIETEHLKQFGFLVG